MEVSVTQDDYFMEFEGDRWFDRNKEAIVAGNKFDWPIELIRKIRHNERIKRILELGCSNGWRLNRIQELRGGGEYCGIDASRLAIEDGKKRYKGITFLQGSLSDIPLDIEFDLVLVNFVFHWVSRETLAKSVSEVDRMVKNNGFLIIGDFYPDFPQRRKYHHLPGSNVLTFKQDYSKIFETLGTYKEIARITYNHDAPNDMIGFYESGIRGYCSILHKSFSDYYLEI